MSRHILSKYLDILKDSVHFSLLLPRDDSALHGCLERPRPARGGSGGRGGRSARSSGGPNRPRCSVRHSSYSSSHVLCGRCGCGQGGAREGCSLEQDRGLLLYRPGCRGSHRRYKHRRYLRGTLSSLQKSSTHLEHARAPHLAQRRS